MAFDLCLQQGALKTSFLLQMVTGSAGILAFVFGCVLIHLAILINSKIKQRRYSDDETEISIDEQVSEMYTQYEYPVKNGSQKRKFEVYEI